jgi:hypothetical protein
MMWLVVCGGNCRLVNITNQVLTMADGGGTADIERLRNLNNDLLTGNAELTATVCSLKDDYIETRNELDRTKGKLKKVNNLNKTLAAMFHAGKEKRMTGKGFMAMLIEVGREDMGVKLALDLY